MRYCFCSSESLPLEVLQKQKHVKSYVKLGVVAQPVIPIVRRFRKEDGRFRDSSGYIARLCLKIQKKGWNGEEICCSYSGSDLSAHCTHVVHRQTRTHECT